MSFSSFRLQILKKRSDFTEASRGYRVTTPSFVLLCYKPLLETKPLSSLTSSLESFGQVYSLEKACSPVATPTSSLSCGESVTSLFAQRAAIIGEVAANQKETLPSEIEPTKAAKYPEAECLTRDDTTFAKPHFTSAKKLNKKSLIIKTADLFDFPFFFGLTITKKIGKAVLRNRIRRRLRAAIGVAAPLVSISALQGERYHFILIARLGAEKHPFSVLVEDIKQGVTRGLRKLDSGGFHTKPPSATRNALTSSHKNRSNKKTNLQK